MQSIESTIRTLRLQSFTSLKADLVHDINGGFAFSWRLNGTQKRIFVFFTHFIWVNVPMS